MNRLQIVKALNPARSVVRCLRLRAIPLLNRIGHHNCTVGVVRNLRIIEVCVLGRSAV